MSADITLLVDRITMKWDALSTEELKHLPSLRWLNPDHPVAIAGWPGTVKDLWLHSFTDLTDVERAFIRTMIGWKRVVIHVKWEESTFQYKGIPKELGKSNLNGKPTVGLCVEMIEELA